MFRQIHFLMYCKIQAVLVELHQVNCYEMKASTCSQSLYIDPNSICANIIKFKKTSL